MTIALLIGGLIAVTSAGATVYNIKQNHALIEYVDALNSTLAQVAGSMTTITEGMQKFSDQTKAIREYAAEGLREVYDVVEKARCSTMQDFNTLQVQLSLAQYRNYLSRQLSTVVHAASTGEVTPDVIGVKWVKEILNANPTLKYSLLKDEVSLFYRYATAIPVQFNLEGLHFAYILRVPNPSPKDILPLYRIYNVGFHQPNLALHDKDGDKGLVYQAPFPEYAVLQGAKGLAPLVHENCRRDAGLMYCDTNAMLFADTKSPCSVLLTQPVCNGCEAQLNCEKDIVLDIGEFQPTRVITTPAGVSVRSRIDPVRIFDRAPDRFPGVGGKLVSVSPHYTYWLLHSGFTFFTVGTALYASQGHDYHFTKVFSPTRLNLSGKPI